MKQKKIVLLIADKDYQPIEYGVTKEDSPKTLHLKYSPQAINREWLPLPIHRQLQSISPSLKSILTTSMDSF